MEPEFDKESPEASTSLFDDVMNGKQRNDSINIDDALDQ